VKHGVALGLFAGCWPLVAAGQAALNPRQLAESLTQAGRPWHAAETLLDASARLPRQDPAFILQSARAELRARRFDRAKSLLVGQPWLPEYGDGDALAVLGAAERRLGQPRIAARQFAEASTLASGARAALFAVHAALAFEAGGETDSAARYFASARAGGLAVIDPWLRLREARVQRDTGVARRLLAGLPPVVERQATGARAAALLAAGDSAAARTAFRAAGDPIPAIRLSLGLGDVTAARRELYALLTRAPRSDEAGAALTLTRGPLAPRTAEERVALARAQAAHRAVGEARGQVTRAIAQGDSSAATLMLAGELYTAGGRYHDAAAAYRAAARDSTWTALALYRRARLWLRVGDRAAPAALEGFAARFPGDTAAPTALYLLGDYYDDHGDAAAASRWFGELTRRYPTDQRSSLARFRLAASARGHGDADSAVRLYGTEVALRGAQAIAARYWLARLARERGDSGTADSLWRVLAREDSLGYYGLHARRVAGLRALRLAPDSAAITPAAASGLARIDTLLLAGLDSEAEHEVHWILMHPPPGLDDQLGWSAGLSARGWGSAAVRLAWLAATRAPGDIRVLRAIYPWPHRAAVEAEAEEFGVDPVLFAAIVRQESVFDLDALSRAGARGLAQLMPRTAAQAARGLDVTFYPDWLTVPDLNLHLGASHLDALLRRFKGRVEVAVAAYNAGATPVTRWLKRPGAEDPDQFIEQIPYPETRAYVRAVLRNRGLYRALYASPSN
jgi:soluble lytic murein transglycosylase